MLVDVRVTVWAADEHDYDQLVLVVLPRLHEVFADFATATNWGAVGMDDPARAYQVRFPLRVEAPDAAAAAKIAKRGVQQAMRDAGVRGVVSVLDGWPAG
jgi:hypothetical protein